VTVSGSLREQSAARLALVGTSSTAAEAAQHLGLSVRALMGRIRHAWLVAFKHGNLWWVPLWQFDLEHETGVLPGLRPLIRAYPHGVVTLST
jgi:hypothetical protein